MARILPLTGIFPQEKAKLPLEMRELLLLFYND